MNTEGTGRPATRRTSWGRGSRAGEAECVQRGTAAIEVVLVAPLLMVILLFVVGLGHMAHARQQIESVAADSARAASLERSAPRSASAARVAAQRSLGEAGVSCRDLEVNVDLTSYQPGGQVRVTVSCSAHLGDFAMAGFPGRRTFTATATVPIESYRAG